MRFALAFFMAPDFTTAATALLVLVNRFLVNMPELLQLIFLARPMPRDSEIRWASLTVNFLAFAASKKLVEYAALLFKEWRLAWAAWRHCENLRAYLDFLSMLNDWTRRDSLRSFLFAPLTKFIETTVAFLVPSILNVVSGPARFFVTWFKASFFFYAVFWAPDYLCSWLLRGLFMRGL